MERFARLRLQPARNRPDVYMRRHQERPYIKRAERRCVKPAATQNRRELNLADTESGLSIVPIVDLYLATPSVKATAACRKQGLVSLQNGQPGLYLVQLWVNDIPFVVGQLQPGETRVLDIAAALQPGESNAAPVRGEGAGGPGDRRPDRRHDPRRSTGPRHPTSVSAPIVDAPRGTDSPTPVDDADAPMAPEVAPEVASEVSPAEDTPPDQDAYTGTGPELRPMPPSGV
jgi:hypothetical protein